MKKIFMSLILLISTNSFASGSSKCNDLNKALDGDYNVTISSVGEESFEAVYNFIKIKKNLFDLEVYDLNENLQLKFQVTLKVVDNDFGGACYVVYPEVDGESKKLQVGPVWTNLFGTKILSTELYSGDLSFSLSDR